MTTAIIFIKRKQLSQDKNYKILKNVKNNNY